MRGWSRGAPHREGYIRAVRTPLLLTALLLLPTPAFAAPPDLMGATLMSAIPAVESCRAAAISRKEPAVGTLSVIIEPGDEGAMVGSASSLELSNALITCITDRLGTVRLPPDATGHEAVWTLPAKGGVGLVMHVTEAMVDPTPPNLAPQTVWVDKLESSRPIVVDPTVEAAFAAALPGVRACRDDGKKKGLRADGTVTTEFYLLADEPVVGPTYSKTVDPAVLACVHKALMATNVPKYPDATDLQLFLPVTGPIDLGFGRQKLSDVTPEYRALVKARLETDAPYFALCYFAAGTDGELPHVGPAEIAIAGNGVVIDARAHTDLEVERCVRTLTMGIRFPEFPGESTIVGHSFEPVRPVPMPVDRVSQIRGCLSPLDLEGLKVGLFRGGASPIAILPKRSTPGIDLLAGTPNVRACLTLAMASLPDPDTIYYFVGPIDMSIDNSE